jgi:Fe-S-cluster containining protein
MHARKRKLPLLVERSVGQVEALRHELADRFDLKMRAEAVPVTCRAGCAHCCYHPISISILEAISIYRWLVAHQKWTLGLRKALNKASELQLGTSFETWLLSLIPCPLLDEDKRCTAYAARPFVCRTYAATSDPHYCHPHRLGEQTKLVSRDNLSETFHRQQEALLRNHRLQLTTMPIGSALLLAERICGNEVELNEVDRLVYEEYVAHG